MSDNNETKQKTLNLDELLELDEINKNFLESERKKTKRYTKEELKKHKKENRYYLPVLGLNDETAWPPSPKSKRELFTDEAAEKVCLSNCCGEPGVFSACCRIDPEDIEHVLGPVSEKWVKRFLRYAKKKGWDYKREDVVIDFEEGKLIGEGLFNNHPIFSRPSSYPMMRLQIMGPRYACKFLNPKSGTCNIYEQRPHMCKFYYCQYIKKNFLVRTAQHPNRYVRIDKNNK